MQDVTRLLEQANYRRIDPSDINLIMTRETHYGLDLQVDLSAFEEILIYYRGATSTRESGAACGASCGKRSSMFRSFSGYSCCSN